MTLNVDNGTTSNPVEIANVFNKYFSTIAEKTKSNIKYTHKHFSDYLNNRTAESFFLSPTSKEEVSDIISSLNSNKSVGPNSIPYRILDILKKEISIYCLS